VFGIYMVHFARVFEELRGVYVSLNWVDKLGQV
jgi:hypothetical protein